LSGGEEQPIAFVGHLVPVALPSSRSQFSARLMPSCPADSGLWFNLSHPLHSQTVARSYFGPTPDWGWSDPELLTSQLQSDWHVKSFSSPTLAVHPRLK